MMCLEFGVGDDSSSDDKVFYWRIVKIGVWVGVGFWEDFLKGVRFEFFVKEDYFIEKRKEILDKISWVFKV